MIAEITDGLPDAYSIIDAEGFLVSPGLIDTRLHNHGGHYGNRRKLLSQDKSDTSSALQ